MPCHVYAVHGCPSPSCSTLGIMMEEFSKAADIVADVLLKAEVDWARLFEPYPFFSLFKNFLQVCERPQYCCLASICRSQLPHNHQL